MFFGLFTGHCQILRKKLKFVQRSQRFPNLVAIWQFLQASCFDVMVTAPPPWDISGVLVTSPPHSLLEMIARSLLDHHYIAARSPLCYR